MKKPINNLEYLTHCPACRKQYERWSVTVLEREEKKATLHLNCPYCQSSSLIFLVANQNGVFSLGMVTDVTREEARKMMEREAVSQNDVIGIHESLKQSQHIEELILN